MTVKNDEREQIRCGLERVFRHQPINPCNQFGRVIAVAAGADWYTLRQLEARIFARFPRHKDTQAAISARLRQVSPEKCGLTKQRRTLRIGDKSVYQYRLVPSEVACD